jgi:hypothetical protein
MDKIFEEIKFEREKQDKKYGGSSHDDEHNENDWIAFIIKQLGKSLTQTFRYQMIRVAALAISAIQWTDRKNDVHRN